jgi:hypothetical protein
MLGLGISISLTPTGAGNLRGAAQMLFNDYFTIVTADGGTVEAESCVESAEFRLGVRNTGDYIDLIFQRWTLDGGIIEGQACFTNALFDLNSYIEIAWNTSIEVWSTTTEIWNL